MRPLIKTGFELLLALSLLPEPVALAQGNGYEVNDNLVQEYLDGVYSTAEAAKYDAPTRHEYENIVDPAVSVFEDNVTQNPYGNYVTNDDLSHFIDEGRRYRRYESQISCNTYDCYRRKYRDRYQHITGCHVCNGLTRLWFRYASIQRIPFYPSYAYYRGSRLRTYRSNVIYRGESCPIYYDYRGRGWMFEYEGNGYGLSF
jgi:hypothetical protein